MEIQPALAALAKQNMALNGFGGRFSIHTDDVTALTQTSWAASFDLVVSNPPFYPKNKNRLSLKPAKNLAKFAEVEDFEAWVSTAAFLLKKGGRFCFVFPVSRFLESLKIPGRLNFQPRRLSLVYPKKEKAPRFFLLDAVYQENYAWLQVLPNIYL